MGQFDKQVQPRCPIQSPPPPFRANRLDRVWFHRLCSRVGLVRPIHEPGRCDLAVHGANKLGRVQSERDSLNTCLAKSIACNVVIRAGTNSQSMSLVSEIETNKSKRKAREQVRSSTVPMWCCQVSFWLGISCICLLQVRRVHLL